MPSPFLARARQYGLDAAHAFERAPMEVALALFTCITLSWALEIGPDALPRWMELAVPAALAFLIAWGATLLHQLGRITSWQRALITFVGGLLACAYAKWIVNFDHQAEGWRAFVLFAGLVCLVAAVPAFTHDEDPNLAFRRVNGRILLRTIGVWLYAQALFAGLALALGAVDKLFELNLKSEIYGHVFGWLVLGLVPWVVVGGLTDYVAPLDRESEVAHVVYRLALFLIPPLLALYMAILYAYAIRIGVTREVPKNLLSPMVVAAGLLSAAAIVLCDPRVDETTPLRHLRLAPVLFVPLGIFGIWAILPRIQQYGWTIFRLIRLELLVVLVLLAIAGSLMFFRKRTFPLFETAVTLAIAAAVAVIGPGSTLAIAKRDQQRRLVQALQAAAVPIDVPPSSLDTTRRLIPGQTFDQINNTAGYLRREFGEESLREVLPEHARTDLAMIDLAGYFHLRRAEPKAGPRGIDARLTPGTPVQADSNTTVYRISYLRSERGAQPATDSLVTADSSTLSIVLPGETVSVSVHDIVAAARSPADTRGAHLGSNAALPAVNSRGQRRGTLILLELSTRPDSAAAPIGQLDGLLLLPKRATRR